MRLTRYSAAPLSSRVSSSRSGEGRRPRLPAIRIAIVSRLHVVGPGTRVQRQQHSPLL